MKIYELIQPIVQFTFNTALVLGLIGFWVLILALIISAIKELRK